MPAATWLRNTTSTCTADCAIDFLHTGLFALVSSKDEHHNRVVEVLKTFRNLTLRDHLVTTNHVVAETITLTRKVGHEKSRAPGRPVARREAGINSLDSPTCARRPSVLMPVGMQFRAPAGVQRKVCSEEHDDAAGHPQSAADRVAVAAA